MRKHLFDRSLYLDALRQLKFIGVAGTLLLSLEAVLIPIGYLVQSSQRHGYTGIIALDAMDMHPLLILCFLILAPIMVLYLFQFLNKRPACDFYHALPNSRISLFFSFFAAVLTWLTAAAVVSTLLSVASFSLLGAHYSFNLPSMLVLLFNTLAASLYVAATFAVGMCVTGTLFTNVTVSLLLLLMPRLLLAVFGATLQSLLPAIPSLNFIPPLDAQYNVVTNLIFGIFTGDPKLSFTFAQGGVYTLCVGVLYTGAACWLFHRRKSESAGKSAPNRALQTVYRLLIAMLICLIPCVMIIDSLLGESSMAADQQFLCVVCYLGAVFLYFLYELFTTRKWRSLLQSIPALGILLVMNGLFIGGVTVAYYSTKSIQPDAEDIQAVRFIEEDNTNEYFSAKTSSVRHTSSVIRDVVSERLAYTLSLSSNSYNIKRNTPGFVTEQVIVYLRGRTVHRNILLSSQDLNAIAQELAKNPTFQEAYLKLPESPTVNVDGLNRQQADTLYKTLREEVASLDFTSWYSYLTARPYGNPVFTNGYDVSGHSFLPSVMLYGSLGTRSYQTAIPLGTLLPKTSAQYMQLSNESQSIDVLACLKRSDWSEYDSLRVQALQFLDENGRPRSFERYFSGDMLQLLQEPLADLAGALEGLSNTAPDITKPLYGLFLETREGERAILYRNAPDSALPDFLQQFGKS